MTPNSPKAPLFLSSDSRHQRGTRTHETSHFSATKNPTLLKIPALLASILYTHLTAVPDPIAINPLHTLRTINSNTLFLGEAQKSLKIDSHRIISLTRSHVQASISTGATLELSHSDLTLYSEIRKGYGEFIGPSPLLLLSSPSNPAQGKLQAQSLINSGQAQTPINSGQAQILINYNLYEAHSANPLIPLHAQKHQFPILDPHGHNPMAPTLAEMTLPAQTAVTHLNTASTPPKPQQNKQRAAPTRRSQRIQEKRNMLGSEQNTKKRTKTQTNMIRFDKDSHRNPLDASKTLQILQATGLTISKQIEDLIDEAVKQDQATGDDDQPTPTTPLHDLIPPFAIPGTDFLL